MTNTLFMKTLASGSSGNATLLWCEDSCILIDAGISYRRLVKGLEAEGLSFDQLEGVLLTHEHKDHVKALPMIHKKHPDMGFWGTGGTIRGCLDGYDWSMEMNRFKAGVSFQMGGIQVCPVPVCHDAKETVGFVFSWRERLIAFFTDVGRIDEALLKAVRGVHLLFVEANHDIDMLRTGVYPGWLKSRVSAPTGHLSNRQMARVVKAALSPSLAQVVLIHMSEENNSVEVATDMVQKVVNLSPYDRVNVMVAPRKTGGDLISIKGRAKQRKEAGRKGPVQGVLPL
jgi:phosphoribosyl 1,2-cyclic phosphodiesterase